MAFVQSTTNHVPKEVDIIIAGGGTVGCLLAARLAKADHNLEILIIERGPHTRDNPNVVYPIKFLNAWLSPSPVSKIYLSKPAKAIGDRPITVIHGNCLGGGSSINLMMYSRGQKVDYDNFNTPGWSFDDLFPLFKRFEKYHLNEKYDVDKSLHNFDGELHVSQGTFTNTALQKVIFEAAKKCNHKTVADAQNFTAVNSFEPCRKWINPVTGKRQDVPHQILYPLLDAGEVKIQVLTESLIQKLVFEGSKAVGVEFFQGDATTPVVVRARKQIVVCAGALGSPQILQRSGIGEKEALSKLGIPIVTEINGVGKNFDDHCLYSSRWKIQPDMESVIKLEKLSSGRISLEEALEDTESIALLGTGAVEVCAKLRPSEEEVQKMSPEFQDVWNRDFKDSPTRPILLQAYNAGISLNSPIDSMLTGSTYNSYGYSRGSVNIVSTSPRDDPDFDAGYLTHPFDIEVYRWSYKKIREIVNKMELNLTREAVSHAAFPDKSEAAQEGQNLPAFEYTKEDDDAIDTHIRANISTAWHGVGTCAMKPLKDGGVVDKDLNVYGTTNLKVADLSIVPQNVAANTYSTALVVGEKAAEIIAAELGLTIE